MSFTSTSLAVVNDVAMIIDAASAADELPEQVRTQRVFFSKVDEPPDVDSADMPLVRVFLASVSASQGARTLRHDDVTVMVTVQRRVSIDDEQLPSADDVDALMRLCDAIIARVGPGITASGAEWVSATTTPYITEHMLQHSLFSAVLTFTFRVIR